VHFKELNKFSRPKFDIDYHFDGELPKIMKKKINRMINHIDKCELFL